MYFRERVQVHNQDIGFSKKKKKRLCQYKFYIKGNSIHCMSRSNVQAFHTQNNGAEESDTIDKNKILKCKLHILSLSEIYFNSLTLISFM